MSDIFISYASEDRSRVQPLADALSDHGWSVWWDRQIRAGKTFDDVITQALAAARCVVVVWSRESVASSWVREEADEGRKRGVLIPVLIDDVSPPLGFGRIQTATMIDWDGARESELFRKLTADVTEIIGVPLTRTAALEGTAPRAPDPGSTVEPRLAPRSEETTVPGRSVRGRTVGWLLAAALAAAILAIAFYRPGLGRGDTAPPPQTSASAALAILRVNTVLADGSEPLARGVAYTVDAAAPDAEGNRKRITSSNEFSDPPRFPLPAGRYVVTASYGSASANVEVEVTSAAVIDRTLNLRAGILRLNAVLADGSDPLARGVAYTVDAAAPDAEGNRKRITSSNEFSDPPRFPLPAGRYVVTASYGSASAHVEVEVTPAGVTDRTLNLSAGILRLNAVLAAGSEPLARGVAYTVDAAAARDAEGNRKRITESSEYSVPPRFPLPAGRYIITASYGSASANAEVEITPAVVTDRTLNLGAGILRLNTVPADGSKPLERGVAYTVYAAARDAEGNRTRIIESNEYSGPPRFPLPAGRYFVTAAHSDGNASTETVVTAGGTRDVELRIAPVAKR